MSVPAEFVDQSGVIRLLGHIEGTGITDATNTNAGAVLVVAVPLQLGTGGPIIQSGTGVPSVGGNVGDLYIDKAGDPTNDLYLYACTTAGTAGNAVWTALVTS